MKYLEHETNLRRIQLEKEIALADAEEEAIKMVMKEETTNKGAFGEEPAEGSSNSEGQEKINEVKPDVGNIVVNTAPSKFDLDASPFEPRSSNPTVIQQTPPPEEDASVRAATLKEIVSLQAKQTELSTLIVNQQRASMLPSQEPPVFNGSYFDYPAFVAAFDAMIANKVDSGKDKLCFLSKYTSGRARDVVKGFLAWNSDKGYEEARKLLAHRFGNPARVAEAYKSKLANWPQIIEGDSDGLQDFSDFLIRCEGAMQSMKHMEELNSSRLLQEISSKLPSHSGSRWCRHAREKCKETENTVSFHDLVEFVKEEADLANDPVFSPEALKKKRNKTADKARRNKADGASSFASSSSKTTNSEYKAKPTEGQRIILTNAGSLEREVSMITGNSFDPKVSVSDA